MLIILILVILFIIGSCLSTYTTKTGSLESTEKFRSVIRTINDIKGRIAYNKELEPEFNKHHGQRKLFYAELRFINMIPKVEGVNPLFVYAGAAPCMHLWKLAQLRPDIKFLLVDPNEFFIILGHTEKGVISHYDKPDGFIYLSASKHVMYNNKGLSLRTNAGDYSGGGYDELLYPKTRENTSSLYDNIDHEYIEYSGSAEVPAPNKVQFYDGHIGQRGSHKAMDQKLIASFIEKSDDRFFIWEDYMTDSLSSDISTYAGPIYFMSDIRTVSDDTKPSQMDIMWNNALVFNWINALKPIMASHKHRCPWYDNNAKDLHVAEYMEEAFETAKPYIDFVADLNDSKFNYFDGQAYIQPWTTKLSPETRLIINQVDGQFKIRPWDSSDYDFAMINYNLIDRLDKFVNPTAGSHGIDNCSECALEADILLEYGMSVKGATNYMATMHLYMSPYPKSIGDLHMKTWKTKKMATGRHLSKYIYGKGSQ